MLVRTAGGETSPPAPQERVVQWLADLEISAETGLARAGEKRTSIMRILVVEDDRTIGLFVITALQQAGFAVDHAEDGASGLGLALTGVYDAAVIDIMLPRLDGLSLIETLRRGKVSTPVIILSAKRSVDDRVRGLQKGGDDYLTKPLRWPNFSPASTR